MPDLSPSSYSLLEYLIATGAALGAFVGGVIAAARLRRKNHNNNNGARIGYRDLVTKYDMSEALREMEERSQIDRRNLYARMEQLIASSKLDMQRVEDNIGEYVGNIETRVKETRDDHEQRMRSLESSRIIRDDHEQRLRDLEFPRTRGKQT